MQTSTGGHSERTREGSGFECNGQILREYAQNDAGAAISPVVASWRFKFLLAVGLTLAFCIPYFLLMYFPLRPVRTLPLTGLDRFAGFDARWVWVYQSIYLPINVLPWLATTREQLWRFARGFLLVCGLSFIIFALFPIDCPRPLVEHPTGMYRLLLLYDRPLNAFPSLHAGLLIYTLLFARRVIGCRFPWVVWAVLWVWTLLILYSTLATKEHYAVDLLAGAFIALAADWVVWHAARKMPASVGRISHEG